MASINLSSLISNSFDWTSVVDQLIALDSQPVTRLQDEETTNNNKLSSLSTLGSNLSTLQSAAQSLKSTTVFSSRLAASDDSNSTWNISAANNTPAGAVTLAVSQLATAARRLGTSGISSGLSTGDDVSALTLATLSTATSVTAGTFTVNGKKVTVALTDSLDDVFAKISAATGGKVTASYKAATDKVTLTSEDSSEVVLGAANDTSNLLTVLRLANNGGTSVSSSATLGSASLTAPLSSSRLRGALSPDGSGNGSFTINGVSIGYNVNTDSISTVLKRINASAAGVTASYDSTQDRVVLTNKSTGDIGIGADEVSGGLLAALGLDTGATLQHGKNSLFTVNGGATQTSFSNTLNGADLGLTGLSVTVNTTTAQTVSVRPDTSSMKQVIQSFVDAYNAVQDYIDTETKTSIGADGKVTTATLADNREVQLWGDRLRSMVFGAVSGLSGAVTNLDNLGIGFTGTDSKLSIIDSTKLDSVLSNNASDVSAFFATSTTGFSAKLNTYLTHILDKSSGELATQADTLNKRNTSIDAQIKTLQTRLDNERDQLTKAFLAMQDAQSNAQSQQKTLENMFNSKNSSSS